VITEEKENVLDLFNQGRKQYKLMEFEKARQFFARALEIDPEDGPSKVYYLRCKHYIENPPPEDWDGVFIMNTK
jgi:tetratricopeptide (TPR) repeat protein